MEALHFHSHAAAGGSHPGNNFHPIFGTLIALVANLFGWIAESEIASRLFDTALIAAVSTASSIFVSHAIQWGKNRIKKRNGVL
jgi:hypothetical protein